MALSDMSPEAYVQTMLVWDFSDGEGGYEGPEAIQEFYCCLLNHLAAAPPNHNLRPKMRAKIREVEKRFPFVNKMSIEKEHKPKMKEISECGGEQQTSQKPNNEEMCNCGEEGCVFTKKEAELFKVQMDDYLRIMAVENSEDLSETDRFMKSVYLESGQPPWMKEVQWKQILAKNPHRKVHENMEDELVSKLSKIIS
jgi:hypothetical protein